MSEEVVFVGLFGYPFCSGCLAFDVLLTTRAREKPGRAGSGKLPEEGAPRERTQRAAPASRRERTAAAAAEPPPAAAAPKGTPPGEETRKEPPGCSQGEPAPAGAEPQPPHPGARPQPESHTPEPAQQGGNHRPPPPRKPAQRQRKRTKTRRRPPTRAPGGQKETAPAKEARGNFAKGLVLRPGGGRGPGAPRKVRQHRRSQHTGDGTRARGGERGRNQNKAGARARRTNSSGQTARPTRGRTQQQHPPHNQKRAPPAGRTAQNDPFAAAPGNGAPGRLKYSARSTPGHPRRADGASNNRQRQQKRQQQGRRAVRGFAPPCGQSGGAGEPARAERRGGRQGESCAGNWPPGPGGERRAERRAAARQTGGGQAAQGKAAEEKAAQRGQRERREKAGCPFPNAQTSVGGLPQPGRARVQAPPSAQGVRTVRRTPCPP